MRKGEKKGGSRNEGMEGGKKKTCTYQHRVYTENLGENSKNDVNPL